MVSNIIMEGDKIEFKEVLNAQQKEAGRKPEVYVSQVFEFTDEDTIKVAMPISQGRLVPLSTGYRYDAYFYTTRGLYYARVVIVDRYKSGNIYGMEIEITGNLSKFQRRQYYRLVKALPVVFCHISDEEYQHIIETKQFPDSLRNSGNYQKGESVDVSGGGMRFIGPVPMSDSKRMLVIFDIMVGDKKYNFLLPSYIIRSMAVRGRSDKYEYRIEFENISKEYREVLIKYIFEEERKNRKGNS